MQRAPTTFATVWKFRFGTPIQTEDGELGLLAQLAVDPTRRAVTQLGVKFGLFGKSHFIPTNAIRHANAAGATISLTRAEVERKADPTSALGLIFTDRTQVILGGKRLGRLTQLTVDRETLTLRHLVVDRGLGGEGLVAATAIAQVEPQRILLDARQAGVPPLTPFRSDEALAAEVHAAIENYPRLRIDLEGIEIHAIDGVVWLIGYVSSELNRRLVQDQLTNIRGMAELRNELIADTDLAAEISTALARDPRTASERIGVYPTLGEVHLRGSVRSQSARDAAGQIAVAVPGVKAVMNELHVDADATVLPVLASVTNEEDRVPGGR